MSFKSVRIIGFCLLLTGCAFFSKTSLDEPSVSVYPAPDPELAALLDVYRDTLEQIMGRKIATVQDTLQFKKPEGSLGNLVADALRFRAASELRTFVHVGITGDSSFRLFFVPGDLTLGDVYEFMPYENDLVVLPINGNQLLEIIEQVAAMGGAPISGVRFRIDENGNPNSILVNAEVIDLNTQYLVATSSWAANGGDQFPALWNTGEQINLNISVREVYADYFRNQVVLTASTDGRIRK